MRNIMGIASIARDVILSVASTHVPGDDERSRE